MEIKEMITSNEQDFRHLSQQDIEKIHEVSRIRAYKKGQVLFHPGDDRTHLFFLKSGTIKIEKIDSTGSFFYLHFLKDKCLFPRDGLFKDDVYIYSAIAYTNIEIVAIPVKIFEEIISRNPQQLMEWIKIQSEIVEKNIVKIQKSSTNNAHQRVITTLAILYKDLGEYQEQKDTSLISCPITINDLSKASGTTRETTSSIIKKLVKQKKISYTHKHLTFLDIDFFNDVLTD